MTAMSAFSVKSPIIRTSFYQLILCTGPHRRQIILNYELIIVPLRPCMYSLKELNLDVRGCSLQLRQRPHYAGEIWKRSFISTVWPTIHTNRSQKRNLKTPAFRFRVDGKHLENGAFRKRWRHENHVISLTELTSNTFPKWPVIAAFLNSSGVVWTENIWCVFTAQPPFLNSSAQVWTENIWCVFRVKPPFSNYSGVESTGRETWSYEAVRYSLHEGGAISHLLTSTTFFFTESL